MAEEQDPFEAALAAMGGDDKQKKDESQGNSESIPDDIDLDSIDLDSSDDPFEAAKDAMESPDSDSKEGQESNSDDPFEAAMAAMDAVSDEGDSTPGSDKVKSDEDPFGSALAVTDGEKSVSTEPKKKYFPGQQIDLDFLMDIKLNITFEVGRTKMFISDLLSLGQGSVIELHRLVGEELDLLINGELLATGEVVVVNEKFGARIVEILTPEQRLNRLAPTLKRR